MPSATLLRHFCCVGHKLPIKRTLLKCSWNLRPYPAFDCLNRARTFCQAHCQQPLQDGPGIASVSYSALLQTFKRCEELITAEGTPLSGNEAPSQKDLQTELSWLFEDAIASVSASDGPASVVAGQLRSSADLEKLDGYEFHVRIPLQELLQLWRRRIEERCPLQYLVGGSHWRDFVLAVGPGVLIPRPETENLIDFCEDAIRSHPDLCSGYWVDLGTGSGALACAVARLLQAATRQGPTAHPPQVVAVDLSPVAVEYASLNAGRLGVADMVDVRCGSWCEPCSDLRGAVSGLVSNPPYIPAADMPNLQLEVQWHEPHEALSDGGADGIASLSKVLDCSALLLRPGGFFAFETNGESQACRMEEEARKMIDGRGNRVFEIVTVQADYFGCRRFCTGLKSQTCAEVVL